jgi:hypothetical protein
MGQIALSDVSAALPSETIKYLLPFYLLVILRFSLLFMVAARASRPE